MRRERQRLERAKAEREGAAMPTEIARGYIMHEGKKIGRISTQPNLLVDPSVHVACFCSGHVACQKWVKLSQIPDTRRVRVWMSKAADYRDSGKHWEALGLAALALFLHVHLHVACCDLVVIS